MYSVALDWLSFTLKGLQDETDLLRLLTPNGEVHSITPRNGYTAARASNIGVQFHSNANRPEMGVHVIIAGSSLRMLESSGTSTRKLLQMSVSCQAKVTRLDLAKDAYDEKISLTSIYSPCENGARTGTTQKINERRDVDGGHTIYVGSWHSDNFFRMYDKAKEQHIDGDWKRLELVCKSDVAKTWARVLAQPDADWNSLLCGKARKMLNVDVDGYNRWLNGEATEGLPQIEKRSDREAWIMRQVIPAVLEHLKNNPNSQAIELLMSSLNFALSERGSLIIGIDSD